MRSPALLSQVRSGRLLAACVALVLAASASEAAAGPRIYATVTGPVGAPALVLATSAVGDQVTGVTAALQAPCAHGGRFLVDSALTHSWSSARQRRISSGRFAATFRSHERQGTDDLRMVVRLGGSIRSRSAAGRIGVNATVRRRSGTVADRCHIVRSWSAARDPGRIYGGTTEQRLPIAVVLAPDRSSVEQIRVSWRSECLDSFDVDFNDARGLRGLPVAPDLSFGASSEYRRAPGVVGMIDLWGAPNGDRLAGWFVAQQVGGSAAPSSDVGADVCDSGRVGWSATSG